MAKMYKYCIVMSQMEVAISIADWLENNSEAELHPPSKDITQEDLANIIHDQLGAEACQEWVDLYCTPMQFDHENQGEEDTPDDLALRFIEKYNITYPTLGNPP